MKLIIPIVPPGRVTRISSRATARWSGAKIAPAALVTTSNAPSANGRSCASASTHSISSPRASASRRPSSSCSGVMSHAVTLRAALGRAQGDVAAAGGDVQDALPGADARVGHELGAEVPDQLVAKRW